MSDGAMTLPAKENALFKQMVRSYETKTFKKGLKTADAILKKFPNHGETLSMKGLILGNMEGEGKREEAHECVKLGLKNDVGSHVCWHVYGLLHRIDRNYKEAIKCYRQALKIDEGNLQILRDLSYMQIQLREIDEFVSTRNEILKQRPTSRVNWMSIVVAQHYAGEHARALETMARFEGTVDEATFVAQSEDAKTAKFELSETHMFKAKMLEDAGRVEDALASLLTHADKIVDRAGWMTAVGGLHLRLAESDATTVDAVTGETVAPAAHRRKASSVFRRLVDRMPDNHEWHALLVKSLGLENDEAGLKSLYAELARATPERRVLRASAARFHVGRGFRKRPPRVRHRAPAQRRPVFVPGARGSVRGRGEDALDGEGVRGGGGRPALAKKRRSPERPPGRRKRNPRRPSPTR
jgi:peptide alpha-N-acetyltransferase